MAKGTPLSRAQPDPVNRRRAGAFAAVIGATWLWAGIYIVGDLVVATIDPISMTLWRWAPAAIVLLIVAQLVERPDWRRVLRRWPRLLLLGVLGMAGFSTLLLEGLRHTTPVSGSLIGAAGPVLIAALAAIVLRNRIGWRLGLGLAISVAGVALVVTGGDLTSVLSVGVNVGDLWIVLAYLCWAAYVVLGRIVADVPVLTSTAIQAAFAAIVLAVVVAFTGLQLPQDGLGWAGVAYLSLLGSALGFTLWSIGLRTLAPATGGLLMNLMPLWTVIMALAIGETIGPWELVGGLVVIAGVVLGTLPPRRRPGRTQSVGPTGT